MTDEPQRTSAGRLMKLLHKRRIGLGHQHGCHCMANIADLTSYLRGSLPKTGPLRFGSENQFRLNFAHVYILALITFLNSLKTS